MQDIVIGIDATNIRAGGGLTHLIELLLNIDPMNPRIKEIIIWGTLPTILQLPIHHKVKTRSPRMLNRGLFFRALWQTFYLSSAAKRNKCNVLLIPGGVYLGNFKPAVVMSQNLLPFEWRELARFSWSIKGLKLLTLFCIQSLSFRNADGLIFLTHYAKNVILRMVGCFQKDSIVIPHGINPQFLMEPRKQNKIAEFNENKTFRFLYVSIIDLYKHQDKVIQAVSLLRSEGFPVSLDLVGPFYGPAYITVKLLLDDVLNKSKWANYHGAIPYKELRNYYHGADLAIFASSCENLPNILIEKMAAGLPIACSRMGPMPEVLSDAGLYFDPEDHIDIANVLRMYLLSSELREGKARASYELSKQYSWSYSAKKTLDFVVNIAVKSNLKTKYR